MALVTGAGKGIGKAIALAAEGVHVGVVARTEKDVTAVAEEIGQQGVRAAYATADVGKREEVEAAVGKITTALGLIDILVNNAGTATFGNFLDLAPEVWATHFRVNVFGLYYATRAVLPQMIARKTGDIINISATAGKAGSAVFGLSESLMQEVRKHNIRVTAMAPSTIVTDLANSANLIKGDPGRVMHPGDFAELIVAQLKRNRRVMVKEVSVFSTNP